MLSKTEMQCTSLISAISPCFAGKFYLLGIGGEVLSIEHINEYFKIVSVVSSWFVGLTSERFNMLNVLIIL